MPLSCDFEGLVCRLRVILCTQAALKETVVFADTAELRATKAQLDVAYRELDEARHSARNLRQEHQTEVCAPEFPGDAMCNHHHHHHHHHTYTHTAT